MHSCTQHVILQDMPSGLRSEVAVFVCKPLIMKVPLFKDVSEGFVESLVTSLQPEVFLAGELIVKDARSRDVLPQHGE